MQQTRNVTVCDQCKKDIDGDHVFVAVGHSLTVDVKDNPVVVAGHEGQRVEKVTGRYDFCDSECFLAWLGIG